MGQVARAVGVSTPYLSEVERGTRNVTAFVARVYADIEEDRLGRTKRPGSKPAARLAL